MSHKCRGRRGVTILETILAASLFTMMIGALALMSSNASTAWSYGSSKMMADNEASLTLQKVSELVRQGTSVSVDGTGTRLTVQLPGTNSEGDYVRTATGAQVLIYLSNGTLYRQSGTTTTVLGRNLTSLRFAVNGPEVGIQLTSRKQMGTKLGITTLNSEVTLRNPPYY